MSFEKIEMFEERPATIRAFRCEKERYVGNSHGVTLARPGDYIVIDAEGNPQQAFTPHEFLSRYKTAEKEPWRFNFRCVLETYNLIVDREGRVLRICEDRPTPV